MSSISTNPELELAYEFINYTNKNIFLTGKAGTGKTTFLHRIRAETIKRCAVVAPTGIAAINAKGMTMHSMFQLPFGVFLPNTQRELAQKRRFNQRKIDLIRSLDLLIIDEISMVRADMLDAVDDVLRRYRDGTKPFGGLQLLMIGDLHQLPPVVKDADWNMLREHYKTPYFFGSLALQQTQPITIQLTHIYRQSDDYFIQLLNRVRNNRMDSEILDALNSRYIPNFAPAADTPYITLTSHNRSADAINQEKLTALKTPSHTFSAEIKGQFPENIYPTEAEMELKVGAQVLFIKNDPSHEKKYYNGKIGEIVKIDGKVVFIKCPEDTDPIKLEPVIWNNVKYNLDSTTKTIEEDVVGTFEQYPLKLAWAITIHKSQGLTFERVIIDAADAFAHGQVYVALSRCKSFEGIVLRSKIHHGSVRTDTVVKNYSEAATANAPNEEKLVKSKHAYQAKLIEELFNFKKVQQKYAAARRLFMENERALSSTAMQQVQAWETLARQKIFDFSIKFQPHLQQYFRVNQLPELNETLQERIKKAGAYFSTQIKDTLLPELLKVPVRTDNSKVREQATKTLRQLEKSLFVKQKCFEQAQTGFIAQEFIKIRANAGLDYNAYKAKQAAKRRVQFVPPTVQHPMLYAQLDHWRNETAAAMDVKAFEVFPLKSLQDLADNLPLDKKNLLKVSGIGRYKAEKYGAELLDIINNYATEKGIVGNLFQASRKPSAATKKSKKPKIDTKKASYDLFKSGKSIEEIATERNLVKGTIEGHLAHYIKQGELPIEAVVERKKIIEISRYLIDNPDYGLADAKQHFGEKYSYGELRMVRDSMPESEASGDLKF